jgi:hypothetical protein
VADSGNLPRADGPENQVRTDVGRIVCSAERRLHGASSIVGGVFCVGVVALWVTLAWEFVWLALALTLGWLVLCGLIALGVENLLIWLAVRRFNRRFPEGAPERPGALALMASWKSSIPAAQKIRLALGLIGPESAPEAQIEAALHQLAAGPAAPAAPSSVQLDPSRLHLGPCADSPGENDAHRLYLPIETLDKPVKGDKPEQPQLRGSD